MSVRTQDSLLDYFCEAVGNTIAENDLTLLLRVGDTIVTGRLVSPKFAQEKIHEAVATAFVTDMHMQSAEQQIKNYMSIDKTRFIHLYKPSICSSGVQVRKSFGFIWRERIETIDGWSIKKGDDAIFMAMST